MRKIFTLVALYIITVQVVSAQTIIKDEIRNFSELAAYELAHPESAKPCETCPKTREADGGLNSKAAQIMPFPTGANIKMSDPLPKKAVGAPTPDAPSRAPVQQWLGHIDNGTTIPPDTYGAVGLNHVVTATNMFIKIHAKVGGAQISQVTISAFTGVASTCDSNNSTGTPRSQTARCAGLLTVWYSGRNRDSTWSSALSIARLTSQV